MATPRITSRHLQLPHLRLHLLEAGPRQGPLVLLLHGFPEGAESWREVMLDLATAGLRVVAPDLRGYGGSDVPEEGYDLDTLAEDVVALAEVLRPGERVSLVGHDWGGVIAYHLGMHYPERLARLAVVNAPHPAVMARRIWQPDQLLRSSYMFFLQLPWLPERLLSANGGRRVARLIKGSLVHPERVAPGRLALFAHSFSRPEVARAAVGYYRSAFRSALAPGALRRTFSRPPSIRTPFRLIWGERDGALGRHLTENLAPYFSGPFDVRYLPDVGHFAPLEAPELVSGLLVEHLTVPRPRLVRPLPHGGGTKRASAQAQLRPH